MNYSEISEIVRADLDVIEEKLAAAASFEPGDYSVNSNLKDFLAAPSKRIRPLLALLYLRACGLVPAEAHYSFLSAIELIHNASLIHDDIIDESETRRSAKSLNKDLGNKLAVISGDYLLSQAMLEIGKLDSPEIINMLAETLKNMCLGEFSQQSCRFKQLTLEEYLLKTAQKTAGLFEAAVAGCEILSTIPPLWGKVDAMPSNFGIAFQIRNDLKDKQKDEQAGIYNTPADCALLNKYIDKTLEYVEFLDDNEYKKAIVALLELLRDD
jgi:geranylgeranyl pyrophosphate synthase